MALLGSIKIKWAKNTEVDLAGYKVYMGTSPGIYGTPIDVGLTLTPETPQYTITGLSPDRTYYFAITAYDNASPSNESAFSAEVQQVLRLSYSGVSFG